MSFFNELKRRNVFRVGVAYAVAAWVIVQIAETTFPHLNIPDWSITLLIVFIAAGLPIALIFAWAFEMTPEGIKLEKNVDRSQSITSHTGRKLDFAIIGVLVIAVAYLVVDKFFLNSDVSSTNPVAEAMDAQLDQSVAVLPFTNRSPAAEDAFFADGVHDDLLTQLAKIAGIKVISRTSVMQYRDTTKTMKQIGDELGVATILEGAVQRAGHTVRINAQLINSETDEHMWAETFDRELTVENLLAIQSEIAKSIAKALQTELSPGEQLALERLPTTSLEAYDLYLKALEAYGPLGREIEVERLLTRALQLDPDFMLAAILRASNQMNKYWFSSRDPADRERAGEIFTAIAEPARNMPEYHAALARYFYHGFLDYDRAMQEVAVAERGLPNDANLLKTKAAITRRQGRFEEAAELFMRAAGLAPTDSSLVFEVQATLIALKDVERFEAWMPKLAFVTRNEGNGIFDSGAFSLWIMYGDDQAVINYVESHLEEESSWNFLLYTTALMRLSDWDRAWQSLEYWDTDPLVAQGTFLTTAGLRGENLWYQGKRDEARSYLESALQQVEAWERANLSDERTEDRRARLLAMLGDRAGALAAAERAIALNPVERDAYSGLSQLETRIAVYALLGEDDKALQELGDYLAQPGSGSFDLIAGGSQFNALREHPEFQALAAKYSYKDKRP